ncbi:MAG: hypothetical protein ACI4BD_07020 [Paludibacteraceae bacterium]
MQTKKQSISFSIVSAVVKEKDIRFSAFNNNKNGRLFVNTKIRHNDNMLVLLLSILCKDGENKILSYTTEWSFEFDNINDVFEFTEDTTTDKVGILPKLVNIAFGGLRGMLSLDTQGAVMLPYINEEDLIDVIKGK